MTTPQRPPLPDPQEVAARITELRVLLDTRGASDFAEALADNIMEPLPVDTAAFRSEELAFESLAATRYLIDNAKSVLARRRRGSRQQMRTEAYMQKIGMERRLLELRVNGIRAEKGMLPNQPNPRQRAMRRLATENLQGDVPKGRIRDLLEEEKQKDRDRKKQQKKERQAARKSQRDGT